MNISQGELKNDNDAILHVPEKIRNLFPTYIKYVKDIFLDHLERVILYGSYARGDFREDSDIDIMILVNIPDDELYEYQKKLAYVTFDINLDNDVDIMPYAKNINHFYQWIANYPFYMNVEKEGILLYERK